ncbi:MAG TPA: hypothetical protein VGF13_00330, partial [Verrucomicrobiae bacterium]
MAENSIVERLGVKEVFQAGNQAGANHCMNRDILQNSSMRLKQLAHPLALVVFASLLLAWPLLWSGFPPSNADGPIHIRWFHHVAGQFWNGQAYPRYFPGLNEDFGSASFFLYPPVSTMTGLPCWLLAP